MLAFLASLRKNRRLLADLVRRDLHARYVGSTMGFFWSVIFPVINLFVYMFVFRLVLNARWSDQQGTSEVALLMLVGIMTWQAFSESAFRMTNTLVENANLIQKVVFPSEILPVSLAISSLVNMLIGTGVAILGVAYFAYVKPRPVSDAPVRPVVFGVHAPGDGSAAPALTTAYPFHCASSPTGTRYSESRVGDPGESGWKEPFAGRPARTVLNAGWGDWVYVASGEWARVVSKTGLSLRIDHWRDPSGKATAPPKDGVPAIVVGEPERALGISISLVSIPVLVFLQGVFMLGLGYLLATFNLFVRDTVHVIGVALTVWMFSTPIFYPERMVRDAGFGWLPELNPMNWLITCYRDVLVYGDWPDPMFLLRFALVGIVLLVAGSTYFLAHKPRFPDLL
ncbi:MAG TPA: ABC transporter permease [Planctomycetota bacterium]|nr:ABC transporter permease [Planctomycetota bacterium]